jgi:predicted RNase H-like HicB family nuclease
MSKEFIQSDGEITIGMKLSSDYLIHQNHVGRFIADVDAEVIAGHLCFLPASIEDNEWMAATVTFQGKTAVEAKSNFQKAVELYISGIATLQILKVPSSVMIYRGCHGSFEVNMDRDVISGYVSLIYDNLTFTAPTVAEAKQHFQSLVDSYLMFCQSIGQEPIDRFPPDMPF